MVGGNDGAPIHECIDRSCNLLADAYRRHVLYSLWRDGSATVEELADAVMAAGLADARERVLVSLVHTHLPKLDDGEVIEYEASDDRVELADDIEGIEPFLQVAARHETERVGGPSANVS